MRVSILADWSLYQVFPTVLEYTVSTTCSLTQVVLGFSLSFMLCCLYIFSDFNLSFQDSECQTSNSKLTVKNICGSSGVVPENDFVSRNSNLSDAENGFASASIDTMRVSSSATESVTSISSATDATRISESQSPSAHSSISEVRVDSGETSGSGSPWDLLREDAIAFVSQTLQRGRTNLWQLTSSRVSVLLSSSAIFSTSVHQFLKFFEDLNVFILAGESFCGVEAVESRQRLKTVCENYFSSFHRQNVYVCLSSDSILAIRGGVLEVDYSTRYC